LRASRVGVGSAVTVGGRVGVGSAVGVGGAVDAGTGVAVDVGVVCGAVVVTPAWGRGEGVIASGMLDLGRQLSAPRLNSSRVLKAVPRLRILMLQIHSCLLLMPDVPCPPLSAKSRACVKRLTGPQSQRSGKDTVRRDDVNRFETDYTSS
jgi:hypothetical protein